MERLAGSRCHGGHVLVPSALRSVNRLPNPKLYTARWGPARQRAPAAVSATLARVPKPAGTLRLARPDRKVQQAQQTILDVIKGLKGRGKGGLPEEQQEAFDAAVEVLEADGGLPDPTASPLLGGRWRLLYTSRPGTASPIQRTFTGVDSFSVFQDIELEGEVARVNNVVDFGPNVGFLKVEAEASTDSRPIPGFVPRRGAGLPFGILGVSSTEPPARPNLRVDFQFDRAAFSFSFLPFKIPYPVPFQLLQDERKGWIDITYLDPSGRFRLSRGNKGTLFVLVREVPPKDRLLEALTDTGSSRGSSSSSNGNGGSNGAGGEDGEVEALIAELGKSGRSVRAPARSPLAVGKWRLRWTKQGEGANPLQKRLAGSTRNYQIITDSGRLENLVELLPWLRVRAGAACEPEGPARTGVVIDDVRLELGPLKIPLSINTDAAGFIEWLYLDQDLRVTTGNKGSVFIHTRED